MTSFPYTSLRGNDPRDTIPDYSWAGYCHSTRHFHSTPRQVSTRLSPTGDNRDRSADIQAALNTASGVVLLSAGDYYLSSSESILLRRNGTLLAGEPNSTRLLVDGPSRAVFSIGDPQIAAQKHSPIATATIVDAYVPVGASACTLKCDLSTWSVGSTIVIEKTISAEYIAAMGMDKLVRNDKPQTWIKPGDKTRHVATITGIDIQNSVIWWNVPLTDSLDANYKANGRIVLVKEMNQTMDVGIEHLQFVCLQSRSGEPVNCPTPLRAIKILGHVKDVHISSLQLTGFSTETIAADPFSRQITIRDTKFTRTCPTDKSKGLPFDISLRSSQSLVLRCSTEGPKGSDCYCVTTQSKVTGPNVIVEFCCGGNGAKHVLSPHQRWATGVLYDNCRANRLELHNRGIMGTGHGWSCGSSIAFSCHTNDLTIQKPPLSSNLAIGCSGTVKNSSEGAVLEHGKVLGSLWREMLSRRVGEKIAREVVEGRCGPPPIPVDSRPR